MPQREKTYRDAGEILRRWEKRQPRGKRRELIADACGVEIAAVGHWINGIAWPREAKKRNAMRGVIGEETMKEYEWEIVLALDLARAFNWDADEREVVTAMRKGRSQLRPALMAWLRRNRITDAEIEEGR